MLLFTILALAGFAIYVMSPDERSRLLRAATHFLRDLKEVATRDDPANNRFRAALRARQPHAFVTLGLVAVNTAVFVFILFGAGRLGDPQTLISWGGNVGPRTTNGEWWRLMTSTFVHSGLLHLLVNMAALFQIGCILERLVGRLLFVGVYVAAGLFGSLVALSAYPIDVSIGASAAIWGVLALLIVTLLWLRRFQSDLRVPLIALARLLPAAVLCVVWNALSGDMPFRGEFAGLAAGLVAGTVLTQRVHEGHPPARYVMAALAVAAGLAVAFAIPVRGIADVRPEIGRLAALEHRTSDAYQSALERFKKGRMTSESLAQVIVRAIVPELQAADAHLTTVRRVPSIHEPLVAAARDYLRLRTESWRLRAEGLRKMEGVADRESTQGDPAASARGRARATERYRVMGITLARAEEAERASRAALQRAQQDQAVVTKNQ